MSSDFSVSQSTLEVFTFSSEATFHSGATSPSLSGKHERALALLYALARRLWVVAPTVVIFWLPQSPKLDYSLALHHAHIYSASSAPRRRGVAA